MRHGIAIAVILLLFSWEGEAPAEPSSQDTGQPRDAVARFRAVTEKLIAAINAGDQAAIQKLFTPAMQEALPSEKAAPFFKGILDGKGELVASGEPSIEGETATLRVAAKRGAWEFRITLDGGEKIAGLYVTSKPAVPAPERNREPMSLPFRGEWFVFWGGDREDVNYHVKTENQRRAADLVMVDASERSHRGDGRKNDDYFAYGQEILAPADGKVVTVIDGVPDNAPGSMNPYLAMGNCVIIEQAPREYAVLAHFKPASLRVKPGDKVRRGQLLGLCGNSGNSSEPHLHFHLQNTAVLQDGTGFTPIFAKVQVDGAGKTAVEAEYTFLKGDRIQSAQK